MLKESQTSTEYKVKISELLGHELFENATAGATSSASIATVVNPIVAYSRTTLQKKKKDGTAVNALDITNVSLFGAPMVVKR